MKFLNKDKKQYDNIGVRSAVSFSPLYLERLPTEVIRTYTQIAYNPVPRLSH